MNVTLRTRENTYLELKNITVKDYMELVKEFTKGKEGNVIEIKIDKRDEDEE